MKEKTNCKYCGKSFISGHGLKYHENRCKNNPKRIETIRSFKPKTDKKIFEEECICNFCQRKFISLRALKYHLHYCINNPNRDLHRKIWNKGLTKNTDDRVRKCGETYSKNCKDGKFVPYWKGKTKETDNEVAILAKHVSERVKEKVAEGTWHNSFSKARTIEYKGINFLGSWEVNFAKYLDSKNINWERCKDQFDYYFKNENHKYTPDFYLLDFDLYIEIKGCPTEKDFAKWNCFPSDKKLDIYFGDELVAMNIVDKAQNVYNKVDLKFRKKNIIL